MKRREAFTRGLSALGARRRQDDLAQELPPEGCPEAAADNAAMLKGNTIICGDCIKTLNNGPAGWVDLVFADPPFNIGYLYHGYDDRLKRDWGTDGDESGAA